jgi:polar amino acid transport system substrate-binding protein
MPRFAVALVATALLAAASAVPAGAAGRAQIAPPAGIAKAGKIVYCSDLTYPPEESLQGSKPVGSDVDIGTALAKLMGVKADFKNTGFTGIIAALVGKRCDAIISAMTDTAARRKSVDFAD